MSASGASPGELSSNASARKLGVWNFPAQLTEPDQPRRLRLHRRAPHPLRSRPDDQARSTPVDPGVAEAALPYLTRYFGNPSSGHAYAERPRRALAKARQQLADLIGAHAADIVFTAGGSEANNLAIRGTALANHRAAPAQVITQASEHPAVLETCRALQRLHGIQVRYLPVDRNGRVDPAPLAEALTPDTVLVSIMAANNETGVLAAAHHRTGGHRPCARRPLPH